MNATANPPAYSFLRSPSYSLEPHEYEQRLAMAGRARPRPVGNVVKSSKSGDVRLTLRAQESDATAVYGRQSAIEGAVELSKSENVKSVEIKVSCCGFRGESYRLLIKGDCRLKVGFGIKKLQKEARHPRPSTSVRRYSGSGVRVMRLVPRHWSFAYRFLQHILTRRKHM